MSVVDKYIESVRARAAAATCRSCDFGSQEDCRCDEIIRTDAAQTLTDHTVDDLNRLTFIISALKAQRRTAIVNWMQAESVGSSVAELKQDIDDMLEEYDAELDRLAGGLT